VEHGQSGRTLSFLQTPPGRRVAQARDETSCVSRLLLMAGERDGGMSGASGTESPGAGDGVVWQWPGQSQNLDLRSRGWW
jgi:hypothetical protein